MLEYLRGAVERFRARPAQLLLGLLKVLFAEGRAVALRRSFERGTVADFRVADDDRGFIRARLRFFHRVGNRFDIIGIGDEIHVKNLPVLRRETRADVFLKRHVRVAFYRDVIVVVEEYELSERVRARKRTGFVGNSFLQTAVAAERIGIVIYDGEPGFIIFCRQMRFRKRHAHRVGDSLSQRPRRRLDADRMAVLI